jgi:bifunctional lysine-specific demethylase and histidyl-hydroxylase NO66
VLERVAAGDRERFAAAHWGRTPLLSRAGELPSAFSDLFSPEAVDELVSQRGLRTPFLRMAKDGSVLPAGRFTRGGGAGAGAPDQVADDKVLALLGDGATLVLQGLHRTWPPIIELANELSADLGHPVQVNAYITPPQNQGFAAHYDVHDVFVLQITGTKQWRVHEPVLVDPLPEQNWEQRRADVAARAAEPPLIDTVLAPGDALYLPRGYLHSAQALGDFSIHLTVGVHPITRHRVMREIVASTRDDPQLRRSLPMGVDLGDPSVLVAEFNATLAALRAYLDSAEPTGAAAAIAGDLRELTRPEPLAPLAVLTAAAALGPDTRLRLRRGLRAAVEADGDSVSIKLIDTCVRFPIAADPALKVVLDGREFTPAQLPSLEPDEQLVIARRLLREGIVVSIAASA